MEDQRPPLRRHGSDLPRHTERDGQAEWPGIDPLLRRMSRSHLAVFRNQEHLCREAHGAQGYNEGISCLACHSIQKTDIQGNANYTMSQPTEYLWQWSPDHSLGAVARNFLIRAWPSQHNRLSKRMYKKPEYCAACHKQFIDQEVNRVGWVQLQNQYDNWAASHWNHKGDARTTVECRECHMPLTDSNDPAAGDSIDYNRSRR